MRAARETRIDLEHAIELAQVERHDAVVVGPTFRGDAARRPRCRRRTGTAATRSAEHHSSTRSMSCSSARVRDEVGRMLEVARESRGLRLSRTCRARARRERGGPRRISPPAGRATAMRGGASSQRVQRDWLLDLAERHAQVPAELRSRGAQDLWAGLLVLDSPNPSACARRMLTAASVCAGALGLPRHQLLIH